MHAHVQPTQLTSLQYSPKRLADFMHQCDLMAALFCAAGWGDLSRILAPLETLNYSLLTLFPSPESSA